jgi:hypothetical protein
MSFRTTISALAAALTVLLLAALVPTSAAAHGGTPHVHAAKAVGAVLADRTSGARTAEIRATVPALPDPDPRTDCADRGCCGAGHCAGCATALAPAMWASLQMPSAVILLSPDATRPASLAREGPARPPKSIV